MIDYGQLKNLEFAAVKKCIWFYCKVGNEEKS